MSDDATKRLTEVVVANFERMAAQPSTVIAHRTVDFYGDSLIALQTDKGIYIPMKPVCDALGVDWEAQRQRIMRDEVLASVACEIKATAADGKQYAMLSLPDHMLHGWLFGISVKHVREDLRPALNRYKREAYAVLHAVFSGTAPAGAAAVASAQLAGLAARVAALEAKLDTAATRDRALLTTEAADGLSGQRIVDVLRAAGLPLPPNTVRAALHDAGLGPFTTHRIATKMRRMAARGHLLRLEDGRYLPAEEVTP